jgi:uncharacterized protein YjbI with pentapeptide repeats
MESTEPEIDAERQKYLAERRSIAPDIERGIYPFKEIQLSRADVEWLLATHEDERGPVDWSDERQHGREGLDLRGADLREVDLSKLPLAAMIGGFQLRRNERLPLASLTLDLDASHIRLDRANLQEAHLEGAKLNSACLDGANLPGAHLEEIHLNGAILTRAYLNDAHLDSANLSRVHLEGANLSRAHLVGTDLSHAHLEGADVRYSHLEGAYLSYAHLEGANLTACFFDSLTQLSGITLNDKQFQGISLVDIHWGDVNVAVVDWSTLPKLGDELTARQLYANGRLKNSRGFLNGYQMAVRAYRQLVVVLRNQGLNEDAARFTYRSQLMQRKVFWSQRKFLSFFGSLFLDLLSGYGYKPLRCFAAYLLVILAFATAYFIIGHKVGPVLSPLGSVVFSMTSFHGRGFFPGGIGLDDPLTVVAALEAFIGLLIEVTFIATLTQRLFGK